MSNPTLEEIRAKLKADGIDIGSWGEQDAKLVGSGALKGQVDMLFRLKSILVGALDDDIKKVAALRDQQVRLQRGGGGA